MLIGSESGGPHLIVHFRKKKVIAVFPYLVLSSTMLAMGLPHLAIIMLRHTPTIPIYFLSFHHNGMPDFIKWYFGNRIDKTLSKLTKQRNTQIKLEMKMRQVVLPTYGE